LNWLQAQIERSSIIEHSGIVALAEGAALGRIERLGRSGI
jgi:hypothetical protein